MKNYCLGCGNLIRSTSAADKNSAKMICDGCYNKIKYQKPLLKGTILLNKAQMLEGVRKNNIEITFTDFSEIDEIVNTNGINKNNIWTIIFKD